MNTEAMPSSRHDSFAEVSKVTAIMCAYNEEETIGPIVNAILTCPLIEELIVVDDGSLDGTYQVVQSYSANEKVKIIHFPENRGKGSAMAAGILAAHHETLLFVDADLLNFTPSHIAAMLAPIQSGKANMVIGQPTENFYDEYINPFRMIAGERALYKQDVLPIIEQIRESRFGVETILNLYYRSKKKRIAVVSLRGLVHPIKFQKCPFMKAMKQYGQATSHIIRAVIANFPLVMVILRNMVS